MIVMRGRKFILTKSHGHFTVSGIKSAAAILNEFKQPNEAVSKIYRKLLREIRVQNALDVTIYRI